MPAPFTDRVDPPFAAEHVRKCASCAAVFTSRVTPPESVCSECAKKSKGK